MIEIEVPGFTADPIEAGLPDSAGHVEQRKTTDRPVPLEKPQQHGRRPLFGE